jgi:hypothetical protein
MKIMKIMKDGIIELMKKKIVVLVYIEYIVVLRQGQLEEYVGGGMYRTPNLKVQIFEYKHIHFFFF